MKHDMDKGGDDGRPACKICGQVEGWLDLECPGPSFDEPVQTVSPPTPPEPFKIKEAGCYKRRDGKQANLVSSSGTPGSRDVFQDKITGILYYSDGYFANPANPNDADIVEKLEDKPAMRFTTGPCFEYIPDRYAIASNILAGLLSNGNYQQAFLHVAVTDAVELTDKLIARVKETQE